MMGLRAPPAQLPSRQAGFLSGQLLLRLFLALQAGRKLRQLKCAPSKLTPHALVYTHLHTWPEIVALYRLTDSAVAPSLRAGKPLYMAVAGTAVVDNPLSYHRCDVADATGSRRALAEGPVLDCAGLDGPDRGL